MIRSMQWPDVEAVVAIHLESFNGFFLARLGARFLKEFYRSILRDATSIALVSQGHTGLAGFAVGTTQPAGYYRRMLLRRWPHLLVAALPQILRRPDTVLRLLRRVSAAAERPCPPDEALLLSIAVQPRAQGQGVGRGLLEAFLREAAQRRAARVSLTTDRLDNERANRFYVRSGFVLERSFATAEARQMNEYQIDL
jgi:ribosomal protein S18 acetylase RimI-like enzyme